MDMATIMDQNFLDLLDRINHLESIPASTPIAACGEASPNSQLIFQNEPFRIHLSDQMSHNHSESVHYSGISKTGRCHFVLSPEGNIRLAFVTANSGYALRPGRAVHQQSGRTRRPHDEGQAENLRRFPLRRFGSRFRRHPLIHIDRQKAGLGHHPSPEPRPQMQARLPADRVTYQFAPGQLR